MKRALILKFAEYAKESKLIDSVNKLNDCTSLVRVPVESIVISLKTKLNEKLSGTISKDRLKALNIVKDVILPKIEPVIFLIIRLIFNLKTYIFNLILIILFKNNKASEFYERLEKKLNKK